MSAAVEPELMKKLAKFGVADATTCFNCGNCTAVCSLSSESTPFPRKMIRYLQLGLKDKLMQCPEPWLCYYCGDCSRTCPRDANPGEVMMGVRRYFTAEYEPTGISRLFYKNNVFAVLLTLALAMILTAFLLVQKAGSGAADAVVTRWLFGLVDYHFIETLGMGVFAVVGLSVIGGTIRMIARFYRSGAGMKTESPAENGAKHRFFPAIAEVVKELVTLKRYQGCYEEDDTAWFLKPWFVHWSIMWGFIGLAAATVLDIPMLGLKDPNAATWLPSRILGMGAGLLLMYGSTVALIRRLTRSEQNTAHSRFSDWLFIVFLWGLGLTGFWLTASVYFLSDSLISQIVLLIHTVMAMELLLLFAFSKFAHVLYRPLALYFHHLHEGRRVSGTDASG
jgi:quinone-modifying oxidoreductase subunit QmoC